MMILDYIPKIKNIIIIFSENFFFSESYLGVTIFDIFNKIYAYQRWAKHSEFNS